MLCSVLLPRLELAVALAARGVEDGAALPRALAPEAGGPPRIGAASAAAEAAGVRPGMRIAEALALCPALELVAPDPVAARRAAEALLIGLEGIGAEVEPLREGLALFDARPLERLYRGLDGVLREAHGAVPAPLPSRLGAAGSRFGALAAARRARGGVLILRGEEERRTIEALPLRALVADAAMPEPLAEALERLGVSLVGGLVRLGRIALRDRFGPEGERVWRIAAGEDRTPLRPRPAPTALREAIALPEAATEQMLQHALAVLLERVLARPERRGRAPRTLTLDARLLGGGSWQATAPLREPTADRGRLLLALEQKLRLLPAPAEQLALELGALAPGDRQEPLFRESAAARLARLDATVGQVRSALGEEAALRIVEIDAASRIVERRYGLVPR